MTRGSLGDVVDRRDLRNADAGDDARRADRSGTDAHLHAVRACVDQRLGRFAGRDVARDHLELAREARDARNHLDHAARVPVRGVDDEHVDAGGDQRLCTLRRVRPDAHSGADAQTTLRILRRLRELDALLDVLDGDQAADASCRVDDRQLLDAVAVQQLLGLRERRADRSGDEIARRHQRRHRLRVVLLEAQVAVREDADELVVVGDRHAGDVVALHQRDRIRHERVGRQRHGLDDHPGLGALHLVDLGDLRCDRHVALDDPDPTFARERDRHARLGDGVHRRRDDGNLEHDRPRQPRCGRDVVRENGGLRGHEEDVVEGEPFLRELRRQGAFQGVEPQILDVHPGKVPVPADEG